MAVIPARVIHETIDDEVLILNLDTGVYYTATKVAAEIWNLLQDLSLDAIVVDLVRRYRSTRAATEAAVQDFVAALSAESLILLPAPGDGGVSAAVAMNELPFSWPRLDRHSDLQRFLLLYGLT